MRPDTFLKSGKRFDETNRAIKFRIKTLKIILLLAIATSLGYTPFLYLENLYSEYNIIERNITFAIFLTIFFIILRRSPQHYDILLKFSLVMILLLFSHILFVELNNNSRHLWFVLIIVASYYLGNRFLGIIFTVLSIAIVVFYNIQTSVPSNMNQITIVDSITIMVLLSIVVAIFLTEYHDIVEDLREHQVALEDKNRDLDAKVKAEMMENEVKTQIMIKESRFAQMGKILSMIAHHWRQPLSSISTTSANMRMSIMLEKSDDEKFLEELDFIDKHVQELSTTINDFRAFFQSSKRQEVLQVKDLVSDAYKIVEETMGSTGIEFFFDLKDKAEVKVYKNEMVQAIVNIFTNASEVFIQRKSHDAVIHIRTFHDEDDVIIEIEDNAGGIDIENLNTIFEPYFSTKKQRNGTGLGLYVSKTIIENQMHGSLDVRRSKEGLCFVIRVPRFVDEDR